MANQKKTEELAPVTGGYGYLQTVDLAGMMSGELDGMTITFDRVKIPRDGVLFEMPGDDEDTPDVAKEFTGVILYHHLIRGYYKTAYTGGNNPPDCGSLDGHVGVGVPGGNCHECEWAKFGTAQNGFGKACREHRRLYILREGEVFPVLCSIPAGSIDAFNRFAIRQKSKMGSVSEIVTRFSLKKAKSKKGGLDFSQVVFSEDRPLTPEEKTGLLKYAEDVRQLAAAVSLQDRTGTSQGVIVEMDEEDDPF